jgi:aminoglycoside phosphotransferase (APT) family kinase protein
MHEWSPEVVVDEPLARRLIREQFPDLEASSLQLLGAGWDTTVWLVDDEWAFRFPRKSFPIAGLQNEIAYLPKLAPLLPLPIPVPMLVGEPTDEFRWPFYGAPFLPGRELAEAAPSEADRVELARPLGEFLRALHGLELEADLPLDPVRRADMGHRVASTRERLAECAGLGLWQAPPSVGGILADAEGLPPPQPAAICHGDLHLRHLLLDDDARPAAVIDWIDLSRNDRGVDLVLYWAVLPPDGRAIFLDAYGDASEEELLRGRVLSLFLCGTLAVYAHREGLAQLERESIEALERTSTAPI